jgi:very-short-patch-repair endonuclease
MRNKLISYNPFLKELARKLRKQSTLGEVLLWRQIKAKALGVEFHRQVPLDNYIVDFYCHELMLAIEIDGGSHTSLEDDMKRQNELQSLGVHFIRFTERTVRKDMNNTIWALKDLIEELQRG